MSSITSSGKEITKGQLFKIRKPEQITVIEQNANVNQRVYIDLKISDKKNFAYFGEEWKGEYAPGLNIKKPDIFVIYFDDREDVSKKVKAYILDLKKDVGGDEVITHLIEQWQDGYKHCNTITQYYNDVNIEFGVICDNFDRERIKNSLLDKKRELEEINLNNKTLMSYKIGQIEQKNKKMIKILSDFLENTFSLEMNDDQLAKFSIYITIYNENDDVNEFSITLP